MTTPTASLTKPSVALAQCLLTGGPARAIANAYLDEVTAYWLGNSPCRPFGDWLARYWHETMPPVPNCPSAAISPHGGGGRGIVWYEVDQTVLGYVPGVSGGYQVPNDRGLAEAISPHCPANRATLAPTTTERMAKAERKMM